LPVFYFSLGSFSDCDTLSEIPDEKIRENAARLIPKTGNSDGVMKYIASLIRGDYYIKAKRTLKRGGLLCFRELQFSLQLPSIILSAKPYETLLIHD
jgi:hypothetical protein